MDAFVEHTAADDSSRQFVATHFLPKLLETILSDYQNTTPAAKESEVLSLLATSINKLKNIIAPTVPMILEAVFECTLQMITKTSRTTRSTRELFQVAAGRQRLLLRGAVQHPAEHQKLVVDSIIWAFKHTERNVADTGLATLFALLLNIQENPQIAAGFYRSFYLLLLQDILAVLTDRLHKFGFKLHAAILRHMFSIVENNHVAVPLWESVPNAGAMPPGQTNSAFLRTTSPT
ncbi:hypothetical protein KRP22_011286 [Phytophthora ramorum]|nr:Protein EXPORTIN 1B [Phytophthora ramorum]